MKNDNKLVSFLYHKRKQKKSDKDAVEIMYDMISMSPDPVKMVNPNEVVEKKMSNVVLDSCCVCCGKYAPEGSMLCPECLKQLEDDN